jgi:hypothetical protein
MRLRIPVATVTIMLGLCVIGTASYLRAQQGSGAAPVSIDTNDIGGTVASPSGPEAGVWVIAETTDLPTKFRKIVVTDDFGRYVCPICRMQTTESGSVAMGLWTRCPCRGDLDNGFRYGQCQRRIGWPRPSIIRRVTGSVL